MWVNICLVNLPLFLKIKFKPFPEPHESSGLTLGESAVPFHNLAQ